MASQDPEQPDIGAFGQDPYKNEPILPDWLLYGFPDFHLPDGNFLDQAFCPASGFPSPEDHSDPESPFQSSPELSDDLEHELLGQGVTEAFDYLGHYLPSLPMTECSDDLGDEPLCQPAPESSDNSQHDMLGQPTTEALTSSSSDFVDTEETAEDWNHTLMNMISQMMFVSGETSEASVETTTIIEEIVHTQVTEIVGPTSPF